MDCRKETQTYFSKSISFFLFFFFFYLMRCVPSFFPLVLIRHSEVFYFLCPRALRIWEFPLSLCCGKCDIIWYYQNQHLWHRFTFQRRVGVVKLANIPPSFWISKGLISGHRQYFYSEDSQQRSMSFKRNKQSSTVKIDFHRQFIVQR